MAALFFLSGATSLIYEVAWLRSLLVVFGSTAFAVRTVLESFMGGRLAARSYPSSWKSKGRRSSGGPTCDPARARFV